MREECQRHVLVGIARDCLGAGFNCRIVFLGGDGAETATEMGTASVAEKGANQVEDAAAESMRVMSQKPSLSKKISQIDVIEEGRQEKPESIWISLTGRLTFGEMADNISLPLERRLRPAVDATIFDNSV